MQLPEGGQSNAGMRLEHRVRGRNGRVGSLAAPLRHSDDKAVNSGSARAEPSHTETLCSSLTRRHGHDLGRRFLGWSLIEQQVRFVIGPAVPIAWRHAATGWLNSTDSPKAATGGSPRLLPTFVPDVTAGDFVLSNVVIPDEGEL